MAKIQLTLLESLDICIGRWYGNNGLFTCDGRILFAPEYYEYNAGTDERSNFYSPDGGCTWQEVPNVLGRFHFIELRDGSLFGVSYNNEIQSKISRRQLHKPCIMAVRKAASLDALINGDYEDDFARADIPELSGNVGDSDNFFCGTADHGVAELPNGDIVVNMYGHFRDDKTKISFFPTESCQYRTWNVITRDKGRSFQYLGTVADVQTWPIGPKGEGYCEPDLKRLQDGRLICIMRSGGSPHDGKNGYTDLVRCTSFDGGLSWSKPARVLDHGVYPQIVQTQNGAIVVSAGRDGQFLATSADNGETWDGPISVADAGSSFFGVTPTGYSCIGEVAPNEIGLVYDDMRTDIEIPERIPHGFTNADIAKLHRMVYNRYRVEITD